MTMKTKASYPIFEADQVLTNNHLNDTVNYLERQGRLSRVRLIGNGIVCGLEITSADDRIAVGDGYGLTSQGYLIEHCEREYTHYVDYQSPAVPTALNLITACEEDAVTGLPYYGVEGVLQLLDNETVADGKKALSTLKKHEYVVVLLLEANQVRLKNCDTNDCNDKGGRLDFEVKPLLVHVGLLNGREEVQYSTLMLKRYGVSLKDRLESGEQILDACYGMLNDDILTKLAQNLRLSWSRYASSLGLPQANPFEKLDLRTIRDRYNYRNGNFHYIQYCYDFIDDLIKAYREFNEKVTDMGSVCGAPLLGFPMHLTLGLASAGTRFGYDDGYRHYFVPAHSLGTQRHYGEATLLLQRLQYMVEGFDATLPVKHQVLRITPTHIGYRTLSERCIPFYYRTANLDRWWRYKHSRPGIADANQGYHLALSDEAPEEVKNPLLYDIERFNAFRIEGHIGKRYTTALSEIVAARDAYNLPFDVVALSATDLENITNGNEVTCQLQDLESSYNVMIAGLLCRLEQILTYVGGLRPKKDTEIGDIRIVDAVIGRDVSKVPTFSNKVTAIRNEVSRQKAVATAPVVEKVNYISKILDLGTEDTEVKLMDFVAKDINSFLVADRRLFEYILPKPDLLLVFLQRLNAIFAYLFEHGLDEFDVDAYDKLWVAYLATVNSIIKESANTQNEDLKAYFAPKNNNVLFNCANEELYAVKEEYNGRLERYREAVTFARYVDKHKGLEHKAGVPKGGTFVLVYQPPAPRYTAVIPDRDIRIVDRLVDREPANVRLAVNEPEPVAKAVKGVQTDPLKTGTSLTAMKPNLTLYANTVSLIERLGLGADASKVLEALKKREEEEKQVSKLPAGVVIADFYLPYLCRSNCPPIAYVFQRPPDGPAEPGEPVEEKPTVSITPTEFCSDDQQAYGIAVGPEGGKLTINGKASKTEIVPAKLGAGTFDIAYVLPTGAEAHAQVVVQEAVVADFEVSAAEYTGRDGNWKLTLTANLPGNSKLASQWSLDGKAVAGNRSQLDQVLTPNQPKTAISFAIRGDVCGSGERLRTFTRNEQSRTVCATAKTVEIPLKASGTIHPASVPKGIELKDSVLVIAPAELAKAGTGSAVAAYYHAEGDQVILNVLTVVLGTASFAFTVAQPAVPGGGVIVRDVKANTVDITLKALSEGGKSTWTVNGSVLKGKTAGEIVRIPQEEFGKLEKLTITHEMDFGDGPCGTASTFAESPAVVQRLLKANNGTITVE